MNELFMNMFIKNKQTFDCMGAIVKIIRKLFQKADYWFTLH